MKVTFPHMGQLYLPARASLQGLGLDVVTPPKNSKQTINLGSQYSPEFACLPFKLNLGNFLEARALGADTVIMAGGVGPCRFGYYAQIQREILSDLGQEMQMVVIEPPDAHLTEVLDKIKYLCRNPWQEGVKGALLGWRKTVVIDRLERQIQRLRAREVKPGQCERLWEQTLARVDAAGNKKQVGQVMRDTAAALREVEVDWRRPTVTVAIVGEIYTVLEPFANQNIEVHLGRMGAEVVRSIYLSQWINDHLLGGFLPIPGSKRAGRAASPYLNHFVGGHGRETVGNAVLYARQGIDGVIQVAPLTCMPEIVAQAVLPRVSAEEGIPVMTLYVDEQTAEAGVVTRLEAFVDMLARRKQRQKKGDLVPCKPI